MAAGTAPADTPYVAAFKSFLAEPQPSGRVVFRYTSGQTAPVDYEAAWFGADMFLGVLNTNLPLAEHPAPEEARGIWHNRYWSYSFQTLYDYADLPEELQVSLRRHGGLGDERALRELFSMGVQRLAPGALRWSGDKFTGRLRDAMKIEGSLSVDDAGRVRQLEYVLVNTPSRFRVSYGYNRTLPMRIPSLITTHRLLYTNRTEQLEQFLKLEILEWQPILNESQWRQYDPHTLFPQARTVVETKTGSFEKVGDRLVPFGPQQRPTAAGRKPRRLLVILVMATAVPVFYFLVKHLRKPQQEQSSPSKSL
ncbi:MAG: hypothetical protein FJ387_24315 [Verrucomicrobia bacterium]|nr:hypothetical protein [Verrucomicrobiota bacterium]